MKLKALLPRKFIISQYDNNKLRNDRKLSNYKSHTPGPGA